MQKVAVILGSDSDLAVVQKALDTLKELEIPFESHIYSAHRTPDQARAFAQQAASRGFGVIIAAAGKAAHLAGSLAAQTILPVIGVPIKSSVLDGAPLHGANARGNPRGHCGDRWSRQCRFAFCSDFGPLGRGTGPPPGGAPPRRDRAGSGKRPRPAGASLLSCSAVCASFLFLRLLFRPSAVWLFSAIL